MRIKIGRWVRHEMSPGLLLQIVRFTKGKVFFNDFSHADRADVEDEEGFAQVRLTDVVAELQQRLSALETERANE
jgi:hypothetical protein